MRRAADEETARRERRTDATLRMGYTRIGHRTGKRVFFERIETDDVTTVLSRR